LIYIAVFIAKVEGVKVRILLLSIVLAGILVVPQASLAGLPSANIPLDSWVYPALDKLSGLGLIDSALQGSRPYTRMEAARQTLEASRNNQRRTMPPVARQLIRRLEMELHQQLVELGELEGIPATTYFKPLADWQLRYINKDGENSSYAVQGPQVPGGRVDARQYALNYNNFGIEYEDDHNAQLVFETEARLGTWLFMNLRPLLLYHDTPQTGDDSSTFKLLEGTVALGLGPLEFSVGRQSLWWGQGRHGSLVLTNNAKPLDMLRLTNPNPGLLPWVFEALGPLRFDLFLGRLEEDRVVPEPYFGGLRVEFKPFPWLSLAGSRTVMFGGDGRPKVEFSDFLTIIGGENLSGSEDTSNSVAAIDVRLKIPALWGMELYGEVGGEDEADALGFIPFISNKAYVGGVYLPQVEPSGRASLRLEYADLSYIASNSPVWYRHGIYQSGYTYENKIMGHHAGGGAEDIFAELEILLPRDLSLKIGYNYETRGSDQPVEEIHRQTSVNLRWDIPSGIFLNAGWKHDAVDNFDYISGQNEDFYLTELAVGGRF
jgi:hypothetical protein